jgi:hypothetical protein
MEQARRELIKELYKPKHTHLYQYQPEVGFLKEFLFSTYSLFVCVSAEVSCARALCCAERGQRWHSFLA